MLITDSKNSLPDCDGELNKYKGKWVHGNYQMMSYQGEISTNLSNGTGKCHPNSHHCQNFIAHVCSYVLMKPHISVLDEVSIWPTVCF